MKTHSEHEVYEYKGKAFVLVLKVMNFLIIH